METNKLMHADYLDIIFDNRNKAYGGYELRKHYNERAGKAMLFLFSGLGILIFFTLVNSHPATLVPVFHSPNVLTDVHPIEMPKLPPRVLPPAAPPPPAAIASTHAFTVPKIVHPDEVTEKPAEEPKSNSGSQPGPAVTSGTTGIGTNNTGASGNGTGTTVIPAILPPAKPAVWVQQMPRFDGDLYAWIGSHLRYPEVARSEGIEGQVVIQFVVNEDGAVSEAKVMKGIGGGCDEEALRMVNSMPKWKPGKQNGIAVKVYYSIPIRFVLN